MAISANAIRGGKVAIEFFGDLSQLQTALDNAKRRVRDWGASITALGSNMLRTGLAMGAGLGVGVAQFANFEQAMADLRAATNLSATDMVRAEARIRELALATGTMPAEVAAAFTELAKAGIDIEQIINGVGEASLKFARISGMPMAQTAIILADAMNMFQKDGLSATQVTDILSSSADAASLSLAQVAESMASGGSIAGMFGQSLFDVATSLAVVAKFGSLKGATAGTGLKTFLTRLATGRATEAGEAGDEVSRAMTEMNLVTRDASGQLLAIPDLVNNINTALANFSQADQDRLKKQLAGMRGLLYAAPLLAAGAAGWRDMQTSMMGQLPVSEKFAITMDTLWGSLKRLAVQATMVGIAVGQALAPALRYIAALLGPVIEATASWLQQNAWFVHMIATDAAKAVAFGIALIGLGAAMKGASFAIGILGVMLGGLSPLIGFVTSGFGLLRVATLTWAAISAGPTLLSSPDLLSPGGLLREK